MLDTRENPYYSEEEKEGDSMIVNVLIAVFVFALIATGVCCILA